MLNERLSAAQKVADSLFAAEAAIDEAIARAGELSTAIPMARTEAKLSAVVGQEAFESAADALATLVRARSHIIATHGRLDETKDLIGLRTRAFGGGMPKPEPQAHLRAVEDAA